MNSTLELTNQNTVWNIALMDGVLYRLTCCGILRSQVGLGICGKPIPPESELRACVLLHYPDGKEKLIHILLTGSCALT